MVSWLNKILSLCSLSFVCKVHSLTLRQEPHSLASSCAGSGYFLITGWLRGGRSLEVGEKRVISRLGHQGYLAQEAARSCVWKVTTRGYVEQKEGHPRERILSKGKGSGDE